MSGDMGLFLQLSVSRHHRVCALPVQVRLPDRAFDEDRNMARTRNPGITRCVTMNLLKCNPDKGSLKGKMYEASMSLSYLLKRLLKI